MQNPNSPNYLNPPTKGQTEFGFDPAKLDGATRIGAVWLYVPPINIHYSNPKFDNVLWTMRQQSPNRIKTGRGLMTFDLDIVFSGVIMLNDKLAPIIAQIRRTPFLTIYNETIRKIVYDDSYNLVSRTGEVPIVVTGYNINTETGLPDTVIMRLSFMVWNYKPMLGTLQYLKQRLDNNGNPIYVPAINIEDSNLFKQYYRSALIQHNKLPDFMFAGEVGRENLPSSPKPQSAYSQTDVIDREFPSRINNSLHVIRNGDFIRQVPTNSYINESPEITIGYHLYSSLTDAFDTSKGAWKSTLSNRWIWTEADTKVEMLKALSITNSNLSIPQIIAAYATNQSLSRLPTVNNAFKYIKKFRIKGNSQTTILGINVRHSLPISILPIVSSPVPTQQYFGGAASDITISIVTSDETFIQQISALNKYIEESARNVMRHSGSELIYLENDIANLNGTFVIETGDFDLQSVPNNPGTYIIQWVLHEQAEVFTALASPMSELQNYKRNFLAALLQTPRLQTWQYATAYDISTKQINFRGVGLPASAHITYTETMLIPHFIRIIRNAFIRYTIDHQDAQALGTLDQMMYQGNYSTATSSASTPPPLIVSSTNSSNSSVGSILGPGILDRLYEELPDEDLATLTTAVPTSDDILWNNRATAYNKIWQLMIGSSYNSGDKLYSAMFSWLQNHYLQKQGSIDANQNVSSPQQMVAWAVADILSESDSRRFELMLRSQYLLDYEIRNMFNMNIDMTQSSQPMIFTQAQLQDPNYGPVINNLVAMVNSINALKTYPDLYMPFTYFLTDNNNNLTGGTATFDQPSFYMQTGSALPLIATNKQLAAVQDKKAIVQKYKTSGQGLAILTGGSSTIPSIERPDLSVNNSIFNGTSYNAKSDNLYGVNPGSTLPQDASLTDLQKTTTQANDYITQSINNGTAIGTSVGGINTFKSVNDLLTSNSMAGSMGDLAAQTSDKAIAESQVEHRAFKSFLKDYNPDINATVADITQKVKQDFYSNTGYYSLNNAFPTFKLYFRSENSPQWFLFDNYFDYRAVNYIKYYKDKASPSATMEISLNDYMYTLTDFRALTAKVNFSSAARNSNSRILDATYQTPIQGLLVKPGTQIQIRLGYDANPDSLPVVMNGFITETEPGEQFIIRCQSYGAELFTESNVGSFSGWICEPKQLIWWMLLSPKVKHLGTWGQMPILPTSAWDMLDIFPFDDNIFINSTMEPGRHRFLQVYNADNMSMWDVLQDIAAAHPGYICDVVPYDYRETIFFGRPDHFYKYTQDLGSKVAYPPLDDNAKALIAKLTSSDSNTDLTPVEQTTLSQISSGSNNNSNEYLNYFQWLPIQQVLNESADNWINELYGGINKDVYSYLLEYCRWVELLTNLSSDPSMGNIQYFIKNADSNIKIPTLNDLQIVTTAVSNNIIQYIPAGANNAQINTGLGLPQQTITSTLSQQNLIKDPTTGNIPNQADSINQPINITKQSSIPPDELKLFGIGGLPQIWTTLDTNTQSVYVSNLIGKPIKLDFFQNYTGCQQILTNFRMGASYANPTQSLGDVEVLLANPANLEGAEAVSAADTANLIQGQQQINAYLQSGDDTQWRAFTSISNPYAAEALAVYRVTGIQSPIAILAWANVKRMMDAIQNYSSTNSINQAFVAKVTNGILGNNAVATINYSDLKTHIALRNYILTQVCNVSTGFQEIQNTYGPSPITKRYRQYHIKTSYEHIVDNNIWIDFSNMWNAVKLKYQRHDVMNLYIPWIPQMLGVFGDKYGNSFDIQAGQTLYERIIKEKTITVENAKTVWQARNYSTSILAEGIRNMYSGTLTILGDPTIKPYDIILIYDDYNKMYGPIMAQSVTHIMSVDQGFVTIIEPQAYVEPMGTDAGAAAFLADIFDIGLALLTFLPGIGELGAAAEAGEQAGFFAGRKAADVFTKQFWKDVGSESVNQGKVGYDTISNWLSTTKDKALNGYAQAYEDEVNAEWQNQVGGWLTKMQGMGAGVGDNLTSDSFQSQVLAILKANNASVTSITDAGMPELTVAMKQVLAPEVNASNASAINNEINQFLSTISLKPIMGKVSAIGTTVGQLVSNGQSASQIANILGLNILNVVKLAAVVAPIAYYQLFAGMDDNNYACPLKITPLTYQGEPYVVGVDSLTHQYGLWNYVAGNWHKFVGSWKTVEGAMDEWFSGISQVFQ